MAIKISDAVKNGRLDSIETTIGVSAVLKIRTGAPPSAITDSDEGTVLSTINLPSDWMAAASGGVMAKSGTWSDGTADASGTAGHFRIYASNGTTQHIQGTVDEAAADMNLDNKIINAGQTVTITSFQLTDGN